MEEEALVTWISNSTASKMIGLSRMCSAKCNQKNIRARVVGPRNKMHLECCLEDVEDYLKREGMKRIVGRLAIDDRRRDAPIGEMPVDPIDSKAAAIILDTSYVNFHRTANSGRLTLYRKHPKKGFVFSEKEVRALKCKVEQYKENNVRRGDDAARERQEDWRKIEAHSRARKNKMRVGLGDLGQFERIPSYIVTTRQAAFLLNVTSASICCMRKYGALKAQLESPHWGGKQRYHFLKADVLAIWHDRKYSERRSIWNQAQNYRNWQEETRRRLMGDKVEPFISAEAKREAKKTASEPIRRKPFERPEWMYSQSRDWTAYTYEVEARVRRTMKPQW